jgi:predicted alpha/beta hydrolase family esterase
MSCLIVPGLHSSGPDHWQSRWCRERDDCEWVELGDWDDPTRLGWIVALDRAIARTEGCPVLVARSLGCLAVACWATSAGERAAKVAGALLVAPPDADREDADVRLRRFAPVPQHAMPFPTIVAASRNDPYADFRRSRQIAALWSAQFHDAGAAGHLNAASGLGSWEEGQDLLAELVAGGSSRWRRPIARPVLAVL